MIDVSTLTTALYDKLVDSTALDNLNCARERSTRINFDPARCPWIGVYPGAVSTTPRNVSIRQWDDDVELMVVAQTASFDTEGTAASDLLEELIAVVLAVVTTDNLTLGITGVRLLSMSREYRYVVYDQDGQGDLFMPQSIIKLKFSVRS
ncbi:MAG: hypothetical protein WC714_29175 [Candidatus Obscuribacterales bacterium]|jgi:hypothetical protein